jgi:signal transduction histidine kinase
MSGAIVEHAGASTPRRKLGDLTIRGRAGRPRATPRWEYAVGAVALAGAVAAFWITINSRFLELPYWLAVQKADFILGPVGVGLYWRHRRPNSNLGLMLIALGLVNVVYVLQSINSAYFFTIGTMAEAVYIPLAFAIVLAFPDGRLDGRPERVLLAGALLGYTVPYLVWLLVSPEQLTPRLSLSGCRGVCPSNPFAIWSTPSWYPASVDFLRASLIAVDLGAVGLLVWKFATGTPPRRRALAIGAPIAICYLLAQTTYQTWQLLDSQFGAAKSQNLVSPLQWTVAGFRAAPWYGFLFALIAAQLFAGRALRGLVGDSLGRPSFGQLQEVLRKPLGDPGLRLGFRRAGSHDWKAADGAVLAPPGPGQTMTEVELDDRPAVAIVHDAQLSDEPELLQAAGSVALLALENAELDAAWKESVSELADSRSRLVRAGDRERRKLERDLHDGAQQRLMAVQVKLRMAEDRASPELAEELVNIRQDAGAAVEALRALSHGIYPPVLRDRGVGDALRSMAMTAAIAIEVKDEGVGRCEGVTEAAVYYCGLEATQNALKHAGPGVRVSIRLHSEDGMLCLEVRDDGLGFDTTDHHDGVGLQNMHDRLGAVGGQVVISSQPGHGTVLVATAPLRTARREPIG